MRVGFTGTRQGMSPNQAAQLRYVLAHLRDVEEFIHGGAEGADREAEQIAREMVHGVKVRVFLVRPGESPLQRNREIVAWSGLLIAAPETDAEVIRAGTWATIRYARQAATAVVMLARGMNGGAK